MLTRNGFAPIPGQLNILLAEDDKDDCLLFQEALEELPVSAHLMIVHDGEQLLKQLSQKERKLPDVLFLDLNMPRKNGFASLGAIKRNPELQRLPVIIFSTASEQGMDKIKIEQVFKDAAHYYIRKPTQFSVLKEVLHKALSLITDKSIPLPQQENFVLTDD